MNKINDLLKSQSYLEILEIIKNIDFEQIKNKKIDEILLIIKILLRYEFDEAALIIYKEAIKIHGFLSYSIESRMRKINEIFEDMKYSHSNKLEDLKTTSEIYVSRLLLRKEQEVYKLKEERVNILLVISSLGPGGAERQFVNLFNHLSKSKLSKINNVYGLVLSKNKENSDHYLSFVEKKYKDNLLMFEDEGVEDKYKLGFGGNARKNTIGKIRKAVDVKKIKIIIGFLEETAVSVCMVALIENIIGITRFGSMPSTYSRILNNDMYIKSKNRFEILKSIDRENIVWGANSRKCLNKYLINIDYKNKKKSLNTVVIPNLVVMNELDDYRDEDLEIKIKDKIVVISIMRLSSEKRPEYYIKLAKCFATNESVIFILIGDGPLNENIQIEMRGLQNLYWIKNTNKISYYLSKANIYVMTSIVEGSPNAVIESSHYGLAAIVANIGGVSETYTDKINAVFVNDVNIFESYALALEKLIENKYLREMIGKSAREMIGKRHGGISTSISVEMAINKFSISEI